jgi:hypothetical protein
LGFRGSPPPAGPRSNATVGAGTRARAGVGVTTVLYPESWTSMPVAECALLFGFFFSSLKVPKEWYHYQPQFLLSIFPLVFLLKKKGLYTPVYNSALLHTIVYFVNFVM